MTDEIAQHLRRIADLRKEEYDVALALKALQDRTLDPADGINSPAVINDIRDAEIAWRQAEIEYLKSTKGT